jgi:hypothetical protein
VAICFAGPSPDRAYVDAVVDGLVKTGVLSQQQADEIKAGAQAAAEAATKPAPAPTPLPPKKKAWYDSMKVGGYVQGRYQYYDGFPNADHAKTSNEFLVRRARTQFTFDPTDRAEAYLELDLAQGTTAVRDAWIQYGLSHGNTWRTRLGQQKVNFGMETPQADSVRLPLEANYVAQYLVPNNRDTGLVLFYTRPEDQPLFAAGKANDWGAGDFGDVSVGVWNGQGLDSEANGEKTVTVRAAKPFALGARHQYAEVGASYLRGTYFSAKATRNFQDRMLGVHAYLSPHPIGFQTEVYKGQTEGADIDGWYGMGLLRVGQGGVLFGRYEALTGPKKGGGLGNRADRHRTALGFAEQMDDRTRLTLEYDFERVEGGGTTLGFDNDQLGLQLQLAY